MFNLKSKQTGLSDSTLQDFELKIQKETQISRSKAFNIKMVVLTGLPAMYF